MPTPRHTKETGLQGEWEWKREWEWLAREKKQGGFGSVGSPESAKAGGLAFT